VDGGGEIGGFTGKAGGALTDIYASATMILAENNQGCIAGKFNAGATLTTSYASCTSIASLALTGAVCGQDAGTTFTDVFYYNNGAVPAQGDPGIAALASKTAMENQGNYTNFDFTNNWKKPSANPLSPYNPAVLSPVLAWQCGKQGIVCP